MAKQLLSCDWCQFHGTHIGIIPSETDKGTNYKIKSLQHGTRVFREVFQVFEKASITSSHRDELLCTIAAYPCSSILRPDMFVCKIENKVLYQSAPFLRVSAMLEQLNLKYEGITRLDLCVDLREFANGWHPLELLRNYRKNRAVKHGSRRYADWRTAPFAHHEVKGQITHDLMSEEHVTHCVTWGGSQSDVHVKMYNKSHELSTVKDKPYIKRFWREAGLEGTGDVWRVEISVCRRSKYVKDKELGEILPMDLRMCLTERSRREVFMALARKHFRWRLFEHGKMAYNAPEIELFCIENNAEYTPAAPISKPTPSRTAKVCANYLEKLVSTVDIEKFMPHRNYNTEILEAAHEILVGLHDGLKALEPKRSAAKMPDRVDLAERAEWLRQWDMLPDSIDGIPIYDIDNILSAAERHQAMIEELAVRRIEIENYLNNMALNDLQA